MFPMQPFISHLLLPECLPKSCQDEVPCYLHKINENLDDVPKQCTYKGIGICAKNILIISCIVACIVALPGSCC